MVTVVSTQPHPSVIKEVVCKNCGSTLQYTPVDIKSRVVKDYGGGSDVYRHITCPVCTKDITV